MTTTPTTPTTFAARAAHFRTAADEALRSGDLAGAATATAFATRCEHARTSGTLHPESNDPILDPNDCCPACGEHFSDPHAPQCPHTDSDLGDEEENR